MKTIEHEGFIYQIGAIYEFSVNGEHWYSHPLKDFFADQHRPWFVDDNCGYGLIREIKGVLGTVVEAPLKLVHGECYSIDVYDEEGLNAIYIEPSPTTVAAFAYQGGTIRKDIVTNIKPLKLVEGK